MILYNTSFHVVSAIEDSFLEWIKAVVVPASLRSGFNSPLLTRLLTSVDDGCSAFALQFKAEDMKVIEDWEKNGKVTVLSEMYQRWQENALAFSTVMEIIDL